MIKLILRMGSPLWFLLLFSKVLLQPGSFALPAVIVQELHCSHDLLTHGLQWTALPRLEEPPSG